VSVLQNCIRDIVSPETVSIGAIRWIFPCCDNVKQQSSL